MKDRGRAGSRTEKVRFEPEEWTAVELAAARAGVSVGEYTRRAVLERAAAEAAPGPSNGAHRAALARLDSVARGNGTRGVVPRADHAVRRVQNLADRRAAAGEALGGNIPYVGQLWEAFRRGGVPAMTALAPPDVIWRPIAANGRALHGTHELEQFWASREMDTPSLKMFHGDGDDVLVQAEYGLQDGGAWTVWMLYRFDGNRLVEAITFEHESEARSYRVSQRG